MLAAICKRGEDGKFLPAEVFEVPRPDDKPGAAALSEFAKFMAAKYQDYLSQKAAGGEEHV